jgi:hypothetical protein
LVARLRTAPRAPLAVAGILATPLFFAALMAMSLAEEKPAVRHVLSHGRLIPKLGDPTGSTEAAIWLLALVPPLAVVLAGVGGMLIGRAGVILSGLAAIAASVTLLVPLNTWATEHTSRYPDGVDLIPRTVIPASADLILRGEWEGNARRTAHQLSLATLSMAALAIALFVVLDVRRRRGITPPPPPPPPEIATGESQVVRGGISRFWR